MKTETKQTRVKIVSIPSFQTTGDEAVLINKIAQRVAKLARKYNVDYSFKDANMDITACHANGCPLRLAELLKIDDGNFGHDVFGIRRFIDRETGSLTGCFLPRSYDSERAKARGGK